ncbi:MAG: hypothetical protein AABZ57_02910, partial [Candidatus Margulisiibacteriota bacterium]
MNDLAGRPLRAVKPLKIVVSTFNGGAGKYLPEALLRAGHNVIEVNTELDWTFPNGNPNPEDYNSLKTLGRAVLKEEADLGVSTDGDGDRVGLVDEDGKEIYPDKAAMVIIDGILDKMKDPRVVIDLKSTGAWERWDRFKSAGGEVVVVPTGHYYTKFGAKKFGLPHWFERSGHFGLGDPYGYSYDDANLAALAFAYAVSKAGRPVSEILAGFPVSYQSPNMQAATTDEAKYGIVGKVVAKMREDQSNRVTVRGQKIKQILTMKDFADFAQTLGMPGPEGYGGRIVFEDASWGLLRASANQPALALLSESFTSEEMMRS